MAPTNHSPGVCPLLGIPDGRPPFPYPHPAHRCNAPGDPVTIDPGHQASFCLGKAFADCPVFRGWTRRHAAELAAIARPGRAPSADDGDEGEAVASDGPSVDAGTPGDRASDGVGSVPVDGGGAAAPADRPAAVPLPEPPPTRVEAPAYWLASAEGAVGAGQAARGAEVVGATVGEDPGHDGSEEEPGHGAPVDPSSARALEAAEREAPAIAAAAAGAGAAPEPPVTDAVAPPDSVEEPPVAARARPRRWRSMLGRGGQPVGPAPDAAAEPLPGAAPEAEPAPPADAADGAVAAEPVGSELAGEPVVAAGTATPADAAVAAGRGATVAESTAAAAAAEPDAGPVAADEVPGDEAAVAAASAEPAGDEAAGASGGAEHQVEVPAAGADVPDAPAPAPRREAPAVERADDQEAGVTAPGSGPAVAAAAAEPVDAAAAVGSAGAAPLAERVGAAAAERAADHGVAAAAPGGEPLVAAAAAATVDATPPAEPVATAAAAEREADHGVAAAAPGGEPLVATAGPPADAAAQPAEGGAAVAAAQPAEPEAPVEALALSGTAAWSDDVLAAAGPLPIDAVREHPEAPHAAPMVTDAVPRSRVRSAVGGIATLVRGLVLLAVFLAVVGGVGFGLALLSGRLSESDSGIVGPAGPTATATASAAPASAAPTAAPTPTPAPSRTARPKPSTAASAVPSATPQIHVVAAGETLGGIAAQYGVTIQQLVAANDIANPNLVYVGQKLIIPSP